MKFLPFSNSFNLSFNVKLSFDAKMRLLYTKTRVTNVHGNPGIPGKIRESIEWSVNVISISWGYFHGDTPWRVLLTFCSCCVQKAT